MHLLVLSGEREDEQLHIQLSFPSATGYLTWKVKAEIKREVKQEDSCCEHVYNV